MTNEPPREREIYDIAKLLLEQHGLDEALALCRDRQQKINDEMEIVTFRQVEVALIELAATRPGDRPVALS